MYYPDAPKADPMNELMQATEGFAVPLVTSCVIPIAMPLLAYWFVKFFFQPSGRRLGGRRAGAADAAVGAGGAAHRRAS